MNIFPAISGIWAVFIIGMLIWAIRLSYAIERQTGHTKNWPLPRYTNLFASAFGGSGDEQVRTQRRRLRIVLTAIAVAFVLFIIGVSWRT